MAYNQDPSLPESVLIYINSKDAQTYHTLDDAGQPLTSDFTYTFSDGVSTPQNVMALIQLHSASIPFSFYNVRKGVNDRLDFEIVQLADSSTAVTTFVEVEAGNYTAASLLATISVKMGNACTAAGFTGLAFSFLYNKILQKMLFGFRTLVAPISSAGVKITLHFEANAANIKRSLYEQLGFPLGSAPFFQITDAAAPAIDTISSSNPSGLDPTPIDPQLPAFLKSTNAIDMNSSIHSVYVHSELTSFSTMDSHSGGYSGILGRVPINANPGSVLFAVAANSTHRSICRAFDIRKLRISLRDEFGRLLSLNGVHFTLSLQITFQYTAMRHAVPNHRSISLSKMEKQQKNKQTPQLNKLNGLSSLRDGGQFGGLYARKKLIEKRRQDVRKARRTGRSASTGQESGGSSSGASQTGSIQGDGSSKGEGARPSPGEGPPTGGTSESEDKPKQ